MDLPLLRLTSTAFFQRRHGTPLTDGLPAFALDGFSPQQIELASRAWTMRAEEEHHAAAVFADLLSHLVDADVPLDLLAHLARIVADELRHTELCTALAHRLHAPPPRAKPLPRTACPHHPGERRARGLHIVLVEGAIGETISSALFAAGRRVAEEPCTKAALGHVLRDEVTPARHEGHRAGAACTDRPRSGQVMNASHQSARRGERPVSCVYAW